MFLGIRNFAYGFNYYDNTVWQSKNGRSRDAKRVQSFFLYNPHAVVINTSFINIEKVYVIHFENAYIL